MLGFRGPNFTRRAHNGTAHKDNMNQTLEQYSKTFINKGLHDFSSFCNMNLFCLVVAIFFLSVSIL